MCDYVVHDNCDVVSKYEWLDVLLVVPLPWQTSKCCEEVKDYIQAGVDEDTLVKGIAEDKNPFKELKGGCVVC